eukprot:COSAG02_NODE_1616_length_11659_cov_17.704239_3_plen_178_part_00
MVRSFNDLPSCSCTDAMSQAGPQLLRPQWVIFVLTTVVGMAGLVSAALPMLEWTLRCMLKVDTPEVERLACLGSIVNQCRREFFWRSLGLVCSVVIVYVTVGHVLAYHLIFKYRTGIHLRVLGSDEYEKQRASSLREARGKAQRRGCATSIHSAASMLDCVEQWQRIALGVLGLVRR